MPAHFFKNFKQLLNKQNIAEENCHIGVAPVAIALTAVRDSLKQANRTILTVAQDVLGLQVQVHIQARSVLNC